MTTTAKAHRDGRGCTFKTSHGYTAYRALGHRRNAFRPEDRRLDMVVVRERHQRHGASRTFMMTQRRWAALLEEARG